MDIGKIIFECLNNDLIKYKFTKKKNMTYVEKKSQEKNFSKMIGYCILFGETNTIVEYMNITKKDEEIKFLKEKIADKMGILHMDIDDKIEDIINYAFEKFIINGYVFHAGNSRSIENNIKNGLNGGGNSKEQQKELLHISSIYEKYGNDNPLGWGILDIKNGNNGWFYDNTPKNMLYYADSPEWFNQFCGGNNCYAWGLVPEENRHGYANRDYDTCLLTVTKLIEKNNMNEKDKEEIIAFFNKCWDNFGKTDPSLLFIPIKTIKDRELLESMKSFYFPSLNDSPYYSNPNSIFEDIISGGCSLLGSNVCCKKNIDAQYLSSVNLSSILPGFRISAESKEREMTILDCIKKLNNLNIEDILRVQEFLEQFPQENKGRSL